jgi:hypothetical protein
MTSYQRDETEKRGSKEMHSGRMPHADLDFVSAATLRDTTYGDRCQIERRCIWTPPYDTYIYKPPYGHVHGRLYMTVISQPYHIVFKFVDLSVSIRTDPRHPKYPSPAL